MMFSKNLFSASLRLCGSLLLIAYCLSLTAVASDFTRWVNPFIGTGGHGHTFPGATMPFGMVQLSPDTRVDNWDGSSGYHYSDDIIYGFSHTHLSGTGIPDGCDILFMPTRTPKFEGYTSKFSHGNEKAEPGYYSVKLDGDGILAELTATNRVGLHRYTFPYTDFGFVALDLKWRDRLLDSEIKVVNARRIEGFRRSSSWAKSQTVYFVAEFSKPFSSALRGTLHGPSPEENEEIKRVFSFRALDGPILLKVAISHVSIEGARKNLEAELPHWDFDKVRADAKSAWNKELSKIEVSGGTDEQTTNFYTALYHTMIHPNVFNDVDGRYKGHDGKIHQLPRTAPPLGVRRSSASPGGANNNSGGSAAGSRRSRVNFVRQPRKSGAFPHTEGQSPEEHFTEGHSTSRFLRRGDKETRGRWDLPANKSPRPRVPPSPRRDAEPRPHLPPSPRREENQYTVFSLWDTFRAAHPLYTIIDQKRTVDYINSFIRIYEQGGRLPVWELWGEETDTMIGYHAVSVIADAMAKGIEGFDYEKAYRAAKHSAELDHFGLAAYKKRGYISSEDENESVSKTLEYAYNDWCISVMAEIIARRVGGRFQRNVDPPKSTSDDRVRYGLRSRYFENLFDKETTFFRPKKNGGFIRPFAANEVTFHFTEGNSWQYSFFVPHDVPRLMELMGGGEKFAAKLDELFTTDQKLTGRHQPDITGLIGQYAHGNEPSHHIPYLYNYAGQAWKTQKYVRKIMDEFYKNSPDGLIGNEDCGQMSAWYVMSALGFYQVAPGSAVYDLGTPLFKEAKIKLESGKVFTIRAPLVTNENIYVRSAKLNGKDHRSTHLFHSDIANGRVLEFQMHREPVSELTPPTYGRAETGRFVAVPVIDGERVFGEKTVISLTAPTPGSRISYTIEDTSGRNTREYSGQFVVDRTSTVTAFAKDQRTGVESLRVEATFTKRSNDWAVKLLSSYSTQYTGGGDDAIVDGLRGTPNFASGEWQGYQGKPFEAVIDLRKEIEIREVGGSFLQVVRSWIWMPARIEFEVSTDGVNFTRVSEIKPGFPAEAMDPVMKEFRQTVAPTRARYVRVKAHNFGRIPAWHPGAGGDPWIFVDEIVIN